MASDTAKHALNYNIKMFLHKFKPLKLTRVIYESLAGKLITSYDVIFAGWYLSMKAEDCFLYKACTADERSKFQEFNPKTLGFVLVQLQNNEIICTFYMPDTSIRAHPPYMQMRFNVFLQKL